MRERTFEGKIAKDGKISEWTGWKMFMDQGQQGGLHAGNAKLTGHFVGHDFKGAFHAESTYRGNCLGTVTLRRVGAPAAIAGSGDAERDRLVAEVGRLKAEAETGRLSAEVARLKADAAKSQAPTPAPAATTANQAQAREQVKEQSLWQSVSNSQRVEDVQAYLSAYPAGTYAPLARSRIKQLAAAAAQRQELALWNKVKNAKDAGTVQAYVDAYPAGAYAPVARVRIKQLASAAAQRQELTVWETVKDSRDPAIIESYVNAYPNGLFTDLAQARINSLEAIETQKAALADQRKEANQWNAILASRKTDDFEAFLTRFPGGEYAEQAQAQLKTLTKFAAFEGVDFGRYHALVIGNNDYKHLPDLKTAIGDARAVAEALTRDYGFQVKLLINANRDAIIDVLDEYVETLEEKENLLIYYAGHGWLSEDAGRGYWLPVDSRKNRRSKWLSNGDITDTLKTLQAKHVMVVADSCYSGTLTRDGGNMLRTANYWKRMVVKRTRVVLSSGGLEPVADSTGGDHSPFAKAFIDALSANEAVMDGTQLFTKMRRLVMVAADQTPQYSDARKAGHEGGDFLFVRKR
jgi:uncharacterized caspase-like protein